MTIWRMRIAKATGKHTEHVILIAFLLQQWLQERASVLRSTCIACYVYGTFNDPIMISE